MGKMRPALARFVGRPCSGMCSSPVRLWLASVRLRHTMSAFNHQERHLQVTFAPLYTKLGPGPGGRRQLTATLRQPAFSSAGAQVTHINSHTAVTAALTWQSEDITEPARRARWHDDRCHHSIHELSDEAGVEFDVGRDAGWLGQGRAEGGPGPPARRACAVRLPRLDSAT